MASKRPYAAAFFEFDAANCLGGDAELAERARPSTPYGAMAVDPVAGFCEAMGIEPTPPAAAAAVAAFERDPIDDGVEFEQDGDPTIEDLGLSYSSVDEDYRSDSERGRTPDPCAMMDADSLAVAALFGADAAAEDAALRGLRPLRPQPVPAVPASFLNQSGQAGCFATDRVGAQPPPPMRPPPVAQAREVKAVRPAAAPGQPPYWEAFRAIDGNHAGVFGECGGVRAWMASEQAQVAKRQQQKQLPRPRPMGCAL